jgi:hypothetical protein
VCRRPGRFRVTLDGKQVRTPGKNLLAAPTRDLAEAIAAEWDAQGENIDPMSMPLTRLANSVIDGVAGNVQAVADDAAKYLETDLLYYRAGFPEALVARQAEHWDRCCGGLRIRWRTFHSRRGCGHVRQPETAVAAARGVLPSEAWPVGAFHLVTTMTGSALLALALKNGVLDGCAGLGRRACGRGLEQREMGRGRRGRGPPRVEVQGFRGGCAGAEGARLTLSVNKTFTTPGLGPRQRISYVDCHQSRIPGRCRPARGGGCPAAGDGD